MSPVTHVTLPNLTVSFAGEEELDFLAVVAISPDRRQLVFLWRSDITAHVKEGIRDHASGLETTRDVPLADFPTAAVTQLIRDHAADFPDDSGPRIIRLLESHRH